MIRSNHRHKALVVSAVALACLASRASVAQQDHPLSIGANYTYLHTNVLPGCDCFSMNGGGAQIEYGLYSHLSLLGDFTATHKGGITPDNYDLTQFTFAGGVRYHPALSFHRVQPFGDLLFGAAHTTGSLSPDNTGFGSSTAFAFQTGGGAEVRLGSRWTLVPVEADYLLTTFSNGADDHQNDLRISVGIMVRLGK